MYLLLVIAVWIFFAYKFVDWSQWKKQYSTILFFMVVNLLYNTLYYNHTLWAFRGITAEWLNHSIINIAFTFFHLSGWFDNLSSAVSVNKEEPVDLCRHMGSLLHNY